MLTFPCRPDFGRIKNWVRELFSYAQFQGCDIPLAIFISGIRFTAVKSCALRIFLFQKALGLSLLCVPGWPRDLLKVIRAMLEDAHENGHPFRLHGVTKANQAALEEIMPVRLPISRIAMVDIFTIRRI